MSNLLPPQVFSGLTDDQLSEMALSMIARSITREDYARLCKWISAGIQMLDFDPDPTLNLLASLQGRVTPTQMALLQASMHKWMGIIQTFIMDCENNNMYLLATSPIQGTLIPLE